MQVELASVQGRHPGSGATAPAALGPVSIAVQAGDRVAVIGPSGAGKTTLLHLIACAMRPAAGALRIDGVDPWGLSPGELRKLRRRLILAPQTPPLPPRQRVVTAVLAARLPGMGLARSLWSLFSPGDPLAAWKALQPFDLSDRLYARVDRLSGGERQRVGLARLLAADARLWLVDEPLSALDPTHARQAVETLLATAADRGVTLVASLHQIDLALACFPRVIGLRDGRVAFDLPAAQVSAQAIEALYASERDEVPAAAPAESPAPAVALPPMRASVASPCLRPR